MNLDNSQVKLAKVWQNCNSKILSYEAENSSGKSETKKAKEADFFLKKVKIEI